MSSFIAAPISRANIRAIVNQIREKLGLTDVEYFPVVEFLEFGLPQMNSSFVYDVRPIEEMGARYGMTYPEKNLIEIRQDVYDRASSGEPRDRFTIAHEIGHYFLHKPNRVAFARKEIKKDIPKYMDPEWQANTFAGELLAPPNIIRGLTEDEVSRRCGVSLTVARIQLSQA